MMDGQSIVKCCAATFDVKYELKRSKRKTISVEISSDARVIVRAPLRMKTKDIEAFLISRHEWISTHLEKARERVKNAPPKLTESQIKELKKAAKALLPTRVSYYASLMGVEYNAIAFRTQKTRFGSCSSKRNLNFNIAILLMPSEIIDYVIVHELAHLKEMNHSPRFWAEVEKLIPDYKSRRKWLKENGLVYISRF